MENNLKKLLLGSWIHDLGKLAWRGGYSRKGKKYETAHSEILIELFNELELDKEWKEILQISSYHHGRDFQKNKKYLSDEDRFLAWCIYMADNISATERNENYDKNLRNSTKAQPIENIFNRIFESQKKEIVDNLNTSYFDAKTINKISNSAGNSNNLSDFQKLFKEFKEEIKIIIQQPINENTIFQIDVLLQNYLTFVPSDAYENIPDISLYDHSKTVTAFAQVLYNFYKGKKGYESKSTNNILSEVKISLIGGDFPSIQKYIFDGIKKSTNITKRLRARSFLVQIIHEAVLQYILDKLNLTRANILISAGGKFVVLTNKIENIDSIQENINQFFIDKYPGLKFSLAKNNLLLDKITGENSDFQNEMEKLFEELSKNKFKIYTKNNGKSIFNPKKNNGKILCKYCGLNYINGNEIDDNICKNCGKEISLGEKLVKEIKNNGISFDYIDKEGSFKFNLGIDNNKKLIKKQFQILPNNRDFKKIEKGIVKSLNLYVPVKDETSIKNFEDILKDTKSNYLVMVKGDVDNMSLILKYGFGNNNYSLSRILTFSRLMELFFGYRLQIFLEEKFKNVYTIYSGGDDFVFVVGLNELDNFIKEIYNEFEQFVLNDKIHFSLGLGIFKDKIPINQIFEHTEDLLSSAKKITKEKMKIELENGKTDFEVLKYFGICFFAKENYVVLGNKENINQNNLRITIENIFDFKDFGEGKYSLYYKLYQSLKENYQYLEKNNLADYVLTSSRILYMLSRNLNRKDYSTFIKEYGEKLSNIKNTRRKKEEIAKDLLSLSYKIYKSR